MAEAIDITREIPVGQMRHGGATSGSPVRTAVTMPTGLRVRNAQHPELANIDRARMTNLLRYRGPEQVVPFFKRLGFQVAKLPTGDYAIRRPGEEIWHRPEPRGALRGEGFFGKAAELGKDIGDVGAEAGRFVATGLGAAKGFAAGMGTAPVTGPVGPLVGAGAGAALGEAAMEAGVQGLARLTGTSTELDPGLMGESAARGAIAGVTGPIMGKAMKGVGRLHIRPTPNVRAFRPGMKGAPGLQPRIARGDYPLSKTGTVPSILRKPKGGGKPFWETAKPGEQRRALLQTGEVDIIDLPPGAATAGRLIKGLGQHLDLPSEGVDQYFARGVTRRPNIPGYIRKRVPPVEVPEGPHQGSLAIGIGRGTGKVVASPSLVTGGILQGVGGWVERITTDPAAAPALKKAVRALFRGAQNPMAIRAGLKKIEQTEDYKRWREGYENPLGPKIKIRKTPAEKKARQEKAYREREHR